MGLIVVGIFGALFCSVGMLGGLSADSSTSESGSGLSTFYFLGALVQCFVAYAGFQMRNLKNYQVAMAGSIFSILPCSFCCMFGLPFGIWSIAVLSSPEVKQAFR
jgi:hypothetical protein